MNSILKGCRQRVIRAALLLASAGWPASATGADWPQWMGPQRDGVWRETGLVERFPPGGLRVRWRVPSSAGYSGPAVAGGRVYLTDRTLGSGAKNPANPFDRGQIPGQERVRCLEESTGREIWMHVYDAAYTMSYPAGPRATPVVCDGRVYTLGGEGHLFCLEAKDGRVIWSKDFNRDYGAKTPLWGYAGHPLIDGDRLICLVGGVGSVVVAFDRSTGRELWRALSAKEPGYSPPMVFEFAGRRQLIVWHPESVNALDPETGRVLWTHPWEIRSGLSVSSSRQAGDRLFLTAFYNGSLMLRVKADEPPAVVFQSPKVSEKDTSMLHSIIPTPHLLEEHLYGVCSYGQLRCLKQSNGERVWETLAATTGKETRWGNAFLVQQGGADRFFLFNEQGDLILARLTPKGYEEISRAHLLEPTNTDPGRPVVWSHPAFANRSVYARNDQEIVCVSLAAEP